MDNPFFSHLTRWDLTAKLKSFFSPAVKASLSDYDGLSELRESMPSCAAWPSFCRAQYLETMYLLPGYILSSQGDRMAMAHSVEGRYPFLDYRVAEFAANLHPSLKMHVLNEKYLLKKAASGMVPPAILQRKKQPYRAPDGKSFFAGRTLDYVEGTLSAEQITKDNIFDPGPVQKLVTKFKSANAVTTKDDMALVGILSTQLLLQKFQSYA
jgi:asparagine synthase (glutamine-hydrolysing)